MTLLPCTQHPLSSPAQTLGLPLFFLALTFHPPVLSTVSQAAHYFNLCRGLIFTSFCNFF